MINKYIEDALIIATTLFFSIIMGCGQFRSVDPSPGVHPDLVEYVKRFEAEASFFYGEQYTIPETDMDLGNTSGVVPAKPGTRVVGWCRTRKGEPDQIMISQDDWLFYNDLQKEQLIFHELGHCALKRGHRNTLTPYDQPISIMHKMVLRPDHYGKDKVSYINELFTNAIIDTISEKAFVDSIHECGDLNDNI